MDIDHWDQLATNATNHRRRTDAAEPSLLAGLLVDAHGERFTPTHAVKKGRRYRYYLSGALIAQAGTNSAQGWRLPAQEIEDAVIRVSTDALTSPGMLLERIGTAGIPSVANAAPAALVNLALGAIIEKEDPDDLYSSRRGRFGPFGVHDHLFSPASPGQGPFFELLEHAPTEGLRLIRGLVEHATLKTELNDPDWTVGIKFGRDRNGGSWLLDVVRARANPGIAHFAVAALPACYDRRR